MRTVRPRTKPVRPHRQFWPLVSALEGRPLMAPANVMVNSAAIDAASPDGGNTQSETTSLAYTNSSNQHIVIVAYNDSAVYGLGNGEHFTGWARSTDGGATFTDLSPLPDSSSGDAGDPILARDSVSGEIYLSTLTFDGSGIQVFRSNNDGQTFSGPVAAAPNISGASTDKEWITVDNAPGAGQGTVYLTYRDFGSGNGIFLTKSTNQGLTWTNGDTLQIASGNAGNVQGADVATGPDHSVYVFYYDATATPATIKVRRSTNGGVSFGAPSVVTTLSSTGVNGDLGLSPGFRTSSFPQGAVNPVNGQVYVVYNNAGSNGDKGNAYLRVSTNHGATWGPAVQVNDDTGTNDQYQPAIAVTPDGSHIGIFWYDRRLDPADNLIARYGDVATVTTPSSITSAITFGPNYEISNTTWAPVFGDDAVVNPTYMGDYDTVSTDGSYFYSSWGDNRNGNPDVYEARIATTVHGPYVVSTYPTGNVTAPIGNIRVTFNEPILTANNPNLLSEFVLTTTSNQAVTVTRIVPVNGSNNTQFIVWFSTPATAYGTFTVSVGPLIYDSAGYSMDENLNGVNGENPADIFPSVFVISPPPPPLVTYTDAQTTYNFVQLNGSPTSFQVGANADDASYLVTLPGGDSFNFFGTTYTSVYFSTNGLITFGSGNSEYLNQNLSAGDPSQAAIAPYWDDLYPTTGTEEMIGEYTTFQGAPALILEVYDAQHYAATASGITFEAVLMLNTGSTPGDIYVEYQSLVFGDTTLDNGESATVGVKAAGTPAASQVTLVDFDSNTTIVQTGNAILISPVGFASPHLLSSQLLGPSIGAGDGGGQSTGLPGSPGGPVIISPWTDPNGTHDARTNPTLNGKRRS